MIDLSFPRDYFDKCAKKLLSSVRKGDSDAVERVRRVYLDTSEKGANELADDFCLMRAQHVVAKEHGFDDWKALIDAPSIEARLAITRLKHPGLVRVSSELAVHSVQGDRVLLEWKDPAERIQRLIVEKEKIGKNFKKIFLHLVGRGLRVHGKQDMNLLKQYILLQSNSDISRHCIDKAGWFGNDFVLPNEILSTKNDENSFFNKTRSNHPNIEQKGTLDQWKQSVARLASGNSRFVFSISTALMGPLIRFYPKASGGFHFFGESSNGKTTALEIAASVWGTHDYLRSWYSEKKAFEYVAVVHNDFILLLDQIEMMAPAGVKNAALMLANGPAKKEMGEKWHLIALSSGEESARERMASTKKPVPPECIASILDIQFDAGRDMGGVEELHECGGSGNFVHDILCAAEEVYGVAGAAWVRWVFEHIDELPERIEEEVERWKTAYIPKKASGEIRDAASRFALVAVAGELATSAGITGWNQGEASTAVGKCFDSWLEFQGRKLSKKAPAR